MGNVTQLQPQWEKIIQLISLVIKTCSALPVYGHVSERKGTYWTIEQEPLVRFVKFNFVSYLNTQNTNTNQNYTITSF